MTAVKKQTIALIRSLPDDCSLEDIQYRLYVLARVERGSQAIDEGRVHPPQKVERRLQEWLTSSGRVRPQPA